jgi:hypothetical protein
MFREPNQDEQTLFDIDENFRTFQQPQWNDERGQYVVISPNGNIVEILEFEIPSAEIPKDSEGKLISIDCSFLLKKTRLIEALKAKIKKEGFVLKRQDLIKSYDPSESLEIILFCDRENFKIRYPYL